MPKARLLLDLVAVLLFVGIGRAAHTRGVTFAGLASTAWPFLSGLAAGWLVLAAWRRDGASFSGGLVLWISTVTLGMVLRTVSHQGIATAFVLVAAGFLGATMLGWRVLGTGFRRWRPRARTL